MSVQTYLCPRWSVCLQGDNGGMTTVSNVTHRFSREDNGLMLNCEAFNKGTRFSKIEAAKISVYCKKDPFLVLYFYPNF